jgi:hypothetical protein
MQNESPSTASNRLPNDVFAMTDVKPTQADANSDGNVMYYGPLAGWHQANWSRPYMEDVTHWSYLPDAPPNLARREARLEAGFNSWYSNQFATSEPEVKVLLRLGYMAGAHFENRGYNF